ncbi:MAG: 2-phospho-L-lactate transferase [Actinomycetota bacterium]|nr:2-phospho-L-lactate transferase [Actinomycetota bacterium]
MKIAVLSGGVGAAKLLEGLAKVATPSDISAIVNVADDTDLHGLRISPDLDTVTYTLGGEIDTQKGWGLKNESWKAMEMVSLYGGVDWFQLGDRDLGTHMYRTHRLKQGASLTTITAEIASSLNIEVNIMPVSDDPISTIVDTPNLGEIDFQDYFVRHQHDLQVSGVRFDGVEDALPGPKVIDTILNASLIIVAPSNPIVSIGPILAIPEITEALKAKKKDVVAISGIIGGKALKGPADRLLLDLGHEVSSVGVARIYSDLVSNFVIDDTDALLAAQIEDLGMRCLTTDTVMSNPQKSAKLCSALLSFCFPEAPV